MADTFARTRHIIGTTAAWAANNIVLGDGELGVERVSASDIRIKIGNGTSTWSALPYASSTSTGINASVQSALDAKVAKTGDTMTGLLVLSGNPTAALGAATKQYVDAINTALTSSINSKLSTAGGTLTGLLTLSGAPTASLHAATKSYVDTADATKMNKAGDTMTGLLTLSGDPTSPLHAATKQYVEGGAYQTSVGGSATYAGKVVKLNASGILDTSLLPVSATYLGTVNLTAAYALSGTFSAGNYYAVSVTGTIDNSWNTRLNGSPTTCSAGQSIIYNAATSKWDLVGDTTSSTAINGKLDKAGGTMTGALILAADPTSALGAATKQYADTMLSKAGGTLTGSLTLAADPTSALQAATRQYVDTSASTVSAAYAAADSALSATLTTSINGKLSLTGGTLTGALTLSGAPTANLHAATKAYVDTATSGAALRSNNLSDLTNAATARANIAAAGTGVANTFTQQQTFTGGISPGFVVKAQGADEGGEFYLEKPASSTSLAGNVVVDVISNKVRIWEGGGTARGAYLNLSSCDAGAASEIVTRAILNPLLGSISTPSGSTATFTGIPANTFRQLYIVYNEISGTSPNTRTVTLGGIPFSSAMDAAGQTCTGWITLDLQTGFLLSQTYSTLGGFGIVQGRTSYNTSTTSIVFGWNATNSFDGGTISVWGIV